MHEINPEHFLPVTSPNWGKSSIQRFFWLKGKLMNYLFGFCYYLTKLQLLLCGLKTVLKETGESYRNNDQKCNFFHV